MLIINEINVFLNYSLLTSKLVSNLNNYIFFHFVIVIDIKIDIKKFRKWKYDAKTKSYFASKSICILTSNNKSQKLKKFDQSKRKNFKENRNASFFNYFKNFNHVFHICRRCKQIFEFENQLHEHFRHCKKNAKCQIFARNIVVVWRKL